MRRSLILCALVLALAPAAHAQNTREVTYTERAVVQVNAKLRFTTMIILPEGEAILDFVCGDKDFWVVSGAENLAYIKPAKAGARTNLNLVTSSGHVYSFLLTEGAANHDLSVYVQPDEAMAKRRGAGPRFYSATQVEELRQQALQARSDAEAAQVAAARSIEESVNKFRASYPTELQFPYRFKAHEGPFNVSAIFHDGRFTYIRAAAPELPSLYEMRDGTPNLVNFQVERGMYVVPKVLESGYLTVGKQKWAFESRR
jgi:type IV secretion system protein VirB9